MDYKTIVYNFALLAILASHFRAKPSITFCFLTLLVDPKLRIYTLITGSAYMMQYLLQNYEKMKYDQGLCIVKLFFCASSAKFAQ